MSTHKKYQNLFQLRKKCFPTVATQKVQLETNEIWKTRIKPGKEVNEAEYQEVMLEHQSILEKKSQRNKITMFITRTAQNSGKKSQY